MEELGPKAEPQLALKPDKQVQQAPLVLLTAPAVSLQHQIYPSDVGEKNEHFFLFQEITTLVQFPLWSFFFQMFSGVLFALWLLALIIFFYH